EPLLLGGISSLPVAFLRARWRLEEITVVRPRQASFEHLQANVLIVWVHDCHCAPISVNRMRIQGHLVAEDKIAHGLLGACAKRLPVVQTAQARERLAGDPGGAAKTTLCATTRT